MRAQAKAHAREVAAVEELHSKTRRHELLRSKDAKQRSVRAALPKTDRKAIQQRLYANSGSTVRARVGAVYG